VINGKESRRQSSTFLFWLFIVNLFFHQAALGDFVLTFPILRSLPGQTTVVAPWSHGQLAAAMFDRVRAMDIELFEFTRLHAPGGPSAVSPAVGELFEQAETIISFVGISQGDWAQNVARLAPQARLYCVEARPDEHWLEPIGQWHRHQLQQQGFDIVPQPLVCRGVAGGPIVVHPGSGGTHKCWTGAHFESLIETLRRRGRDVQPILGHVEMELWPSQLLHHWQYDLGSAKLKTLDELYQVLVIASAFIGNDSGPTHLAGQLGLTTIALFGATDPRRWAPQGPAVTVLAPEVPQSMAWLEPAQVVAALDVLG
jgi:heptosyltransferase-3